MLKFHPHIMDELVIVERAAKIKKTKVADSHLSFTGAKKLMKNLNIYRLRHFCQHSHPSLHKDK